MLDGLVPVDSLVVSVKAWIKSGMPDYAKGSDNRYKRLI